MGDSATLSRVLDVYSGSNGDATKALYQELESAGPIGVIALNLFRAQKCSERAKGYSRRYKGEAYGRKQWSMDNLCQVLFEHAAALNINWGWQQDSSQPYHNQVLYVETPDGQISFHTDQRGNGPDFSGEWDGVKNACSFRVCSFAARVLGESGHG